MSGNFSGAARAFAQQAVNLVPRTKGPYVLAALAGVAGSVLYSFGPGIVRYIEEERLTRIAFEEAVTGMLEQRLASGPLALGNYVVGYTNGAGKEAHTPLTVYSVTSAQMPGADTEIRYVSALSPRQEDGGRLVR